MRRGILLINTGSPATPGVKEVKRYLIDFLTDPRIINMPKIFRHIIVKGIIAPLRAPKSAKKYELIWSENGFPLQLLTDQLAKRMSEISGLPVYSAMRYNRGTVQNALKEAQQEGLEELVIIPLFPHYAMSSFESAVAHVVSEHKRGGFQYHLKCVKPYFDHPQYIQLMTEQILQYITPDTKHLLLSYHGIPVSHTWPYKGNIDKDYEKQCVAMTELISTNEKIKALNLTHSIAYQSRLGHNKWLSPATNECILELVKKHRKIAVICPSFVCDNLETSWEIDIQERYNFMKAGGESFTFIPCPNASDDCARALITLIEQNDYTDAIVWTKP